MSTEEIEQIFNEIKEEFLNTDEYKEIFEEAKDVLIPYLRQWAEARWMILNGDEVQKEIGREVIRATNRSIADIVQALKERLVNYALEKLETILKNIVKKYLLPLLTSLV